MNILRRLTIVIARALLPVTLLAFGALFSINQTLGSPGKLQSTLKKSGIYDTIAANIVQQATSQTGAKLDTSGQQALQKAVNSAVSPSYLEQQTNTVVQGIYNWMQGKTPNLSFSIDISSVKSQLVNGLADQASQRAATLPACTPQELRDMNTTNIDPFTVSCLPPGVTPAQIAATARQQAETSDAFKNSTVTPSTLAQDGKSLQDQLKPLATSYKVVKYGAQVAVLLAVLLTVAVIVLSRPWQRGVKRASFTYLSIGAVSAGLALLTGWLLKTVSNKLAEQQNAELQSKIITAITNITADLRNWWVDYGLVLIGLGVAGYLLAQFVKVSHEESVEQASDKKSLAEPISEPPVQPVEHQKEQGKGHDKPPTTTS
ncbi:MAG TPA: hypothetical protein VIR03_04105 [Candidatus Saccharimonadales bacterium]